MIDLTPLFKELKKMKIEIRDGLRGVLKNVVVPEDGVFQLPPAATDPTPANGKMYYNTTSHKGRICENGVWRDL